MRTETPYTLALHLLGAMDSQLSCQVDILHTLPTPSLVMVILLATHSQCLPSTRCP